MSSNYAEILWLAKPDAIWNMGDLEHRQSRSIPGGGNKESSSDEIERKNTPYEFNAPDAPIEASWRTKAVRTSLLKGRNERRSRTRTLSIAHRTGNGVASVLSAVLLNG
jgi:hypothetical protein